MPRLFDGEWQRYREDLALYYSTRRLDSSLRDEKGSCDPEKYRDRIRSHHVPGDWRFELIEDLRSAVGGRHVLELGCGYGYWTFHLAEVSESVLATDVSSCCLAEAERIVRAPNARFAELDAWEIGSAEGEFDSVVSVNLINHFPSVVALEVVRRVERRLGAGGLVFLAGEHYYGWRAAMYRKVGSSDFVSARMDAACGPVEIVDNPYSREQIRELVGPEARDLFIGSCLGYWWARYRVAE